MALRTLRIHPADNIEAALTNLHKNELVHSDGLQIRLMTDVPAKHKFALTDLKTGDDVKMYGVLVGRATADIQQGELITTANVRHASDGIQIKGEKNFLASAGYKQMERPDLFRISPERRFCRNCKSLAIDPPCFLRE